MQAVEQLIREPERLPTLPSVATRALEELERKDCDFEEVASLVALDPVIAARVLRLANSAFFGAQRKADSVEEAIARLGIRECRSLILTVALMEAVPDLPAPHNAKVFWTLSLASALIAERLARDIGYDRPERAYLAGLVHLLGEAVLAIQFTDRFRRACAVTKRDGLPLAVSLTEEFGCDHAALTAKILERWAFPEPVIDAVRVQFTPTARCSDPLLPCLIVAADGICRDRGLGLQENGRRPREWISLLPEHFASGLREAGYADLAVYMGSLDVAIQEAIDFALTVF